MTNRLHFPRRFMHPEFVRGGVNIGRFVYHDWEHHSVAYVGGHPDFKGAGLVKFEAKVKQKPDYVQDYKAANQKMMKKIGRSHDRDTETWHHHENGNKMQLVDKKLHKRFTHEGGVSLGRTNKTKKPKLERRS